MLLEKLSPLKFLCVSLCRVSVCLCVTAVRLVAKQTSPLGIENPTNLMPHIQEMIPRHAIPNPWKHARDLRIERRELSPQ